MLTGLWAGIGSKLADRWAEVSAPALVFWVGAVLAWITGGGLHSLRNSGRWLEHQGALVQIAVIGGILAGVVVSGLVVNRLCLPALRLLEGYWPGFLSPLHRRLTGRVRTKAADLDRRFQDLYRPVHGGTATEDERSEYVSLDTQLHWLPGNESYQPTAVGNILRAAEYRPTEKYGLGIVTVWPRLWLLLPDTARAELAEARRLLDTAASACVWGLLFVAFTPLAWWAAVAGVAVTLLAYRFWLRWQAVVFADLLDSAFDLYRGLLYEQLRWPLPADPGEERLTGALLTEYLWRGLPGHNLPASAAH